jgi:hypothetical protein
MILSGNEAYSASLMFDNSTKNASKSKIQKAESIDNEEKKQPGKPPPWLKYKVAKSQ